MLILELGIWIIPMTLIFAPCRRLVLLIAKLQQLEASIMHTRSSSPAIWSRIARIQTLSMTLWKKIGSNQGYLSETIVSSGGQPTLEFFSLVLGEYWPHALFTIFSNSHFLENWIVLFLFACMMEMVKKKSLSCRCTLLIHIFQPNNVSAGYIYSGNWSISIDGKPDCARFSPCKILLAVSFSCKYWT